jgi:hypothetical protein
MCRDEVLRLVGLVFDSDDVHERCDAADALRQWADEEGAKRWSSPEWKAVCARFRAEVYGEGER